MVQSLLFFCALHRFFLPSSCAALPLDKAQSHKHTNQFLFFKHSIFGTWHRKMNLDKYRDVEINWICIFVCAPLGLCVMAAINSIKCIEFVEWEIRKLAICINKMCGRQTEDREETKITRTRTMQQTLQ